MSSILSEPGRSRSLRLVEAVEDLLEREAFCRLSEEDFLSEVDVYSMARPPHNAW